MPHTLNPFWTTPPARETVGEKAYRLLREALLRGQIPDGTRINELELARAWNISRTPIRDALRRLEAEGLVQAVPRRGVVVPALGLGELDELYELREILEARAARRAAERLDPPLRARLNVLIREFGAAVKRDDAERAAALDADLHAAIAAASGQDRLERLVTLIAGQVHGTRVRAFRVRTRARRSLAELARVVAAVRSAAPARAEAAMRDHLTSVRGDLPLVLGSAVPGE